MQITYITAGISVDKLREEMRTICGFSQSGPAPDQFTMKWVDDEGDPCRIASQQELDEALRLYELEKDTEITIHGMYIYMYEYMYTEIYIYTYIRARKGMGNLAARIHWIERKSLFRWPTLQRRGFLHLAGAEARSFVIRPPGRKRKRDVECLEVSANA